MWRDSAGPHADRVPDRPPRKSRHECGGDDGTLVRARDGGSERIASSSGGADGGAADARAFQAALVASGHHSRLIEIPSADHFGTTVAIEAIEAILDLTTAK